MAQCHINMKQYKLAVEQAQKCIEVNPSFVKGYYRKALALDLMDKKQEALDTLEMALKKEPNNDMILKLKQKILQDLEKPSMGGSRTSSSSGRSRGRNHANRHASDDEEDSENNNSEEEESDEEHSDAHGRPGVCPNCGGPKLPYICAQCGKTTIKKCSACLEVRYCSRECQIKHWNVHKESCSWIDMHRR